jgi:formylglycine-generating enzyme required for sulfatase activity
MFPTGASPSGVMDMAGNVWEWQANLWKEGQPFRSVRGGAWSFRHDFARVGVRNGLDPDVRFVSFGLRVVASPG